MARLKRTPRRVRKMERRKLVRTQKLMVAMDQAVNADATPAYYWRRMLDGSVRWTMK